MKVSRFITTSPGRAVALIAVTLPLFLLGPAVTAWSAFAAVTLFSIADPFLILGSRSWWLGALLSGPSWLLVFLVLGGTASEVADLREGAMVFLFPMMAYPVALALSALVRLILWSRERQPQGTPPAAAG